ncbi:MAG TPA: GDP-mannose 4,6-dehydratase [Chthoniobacterales bacterium]|jgi:GDPmannose 4,6-dehydratase|nr:GDP-mannose 4,6-dehydratase [Chthoniobacterales bacterium]
MRKRKALITGISGQDGAYLAELLLREGYLVIGTSRDAQITSFRNLRRLGIEKKVGLESVALNDFRSVLQVLTKVEPDEIYHLAGQSSVALSFEQPVETQESIAGAALNLLEAARFVKRPVRIYNASSGECFGELSGMPATESTPFQPRSPYGVAKAAAFWLVANYREAYGLFACSGILFNHESPLRPERFVTKKIANSVARILRGEQTKLTLGNLDIWRDWGWSPEYVQAMHAILASDRPEDFVIATGESRQLRDFAKAAFSYAGLDWQNHVEIDQSLFRPSEILFSKGDPIRAQKILGWQPRSRMKEVAQMLVQASVEEFESRSNR